MLLSYPADCYFFVGYLRLAMLDRNFAHLNTTVGKHHQSWKNEETCCGDPGYNCRYFLFIHQNISKQGAGSTYLAPRHGFRKSDSDLATLVCRLVTLW